VASNGSPDYPEFLKRYLNQIKAKIPANWLQAPARKGGGWRWQDPDNANNEIRIDPGRAEVSMNTQRIDHVVINYNGVIIGRGGIRITDGIKSDPMNAHIPLEEWLSWQNWYSPGESD
jgi:hypothetical protein